MDRAAPELSQTGLPSPYPSNFGDAHSEASSADHTSAAQYQAQKDVAYPTSVTPTSSEYGVYPPSARSGSSYPADHIQRSYPPAPLSSSGGMAQQNSPSLPQPDGRNHQAHLVNSDNEVPIDPSIAAPSPTYPYGQHSPYAPNPDMTHSYSHPSGGMYAQPRPEWGGYAQHGAPPLTPGHPVYGQSPASAPQQRPNQVSLFVGMVQGAQLARPLSQCSGAANTIPVVPGRARMLIDAANRYTLSCLFQVPNSTSDLADAMRRLSACTNVAGTVAKRHMVLSTI